MIFVVSPNPKNNVQWVLDSVYFTVYLDGNQVLELQIVAWRNSSMCSTNPPRLMIVRSIDQTSISFNLLTKKDLLWSSKGESGNVCTTYFLHF